MVPSPHSSRSRQFRLAQAESLPMTITAYLFEKACYSLDALAMLAEDVRRLEPDSRAQRDVSCHVPARHALTTLCMVAGTEFDAGWGY